MYVDVKVGVCGGEHGSGCFLSSVQIAEASGTTAATVGDSWPAADMRMRARIIVPLLLQPLRM